MWDGLESRKFPRLKANCMLLVQNQSGNQSVISSTENIGAGGLCVILNRALDKMSRVKIELDLQDGNEPIRCDGRVVWAVRRRLFNASEQEHDTGIEFLNLSAGEIDRIQEVVNRAIAGKK